MSLGIDHAGHGAIAAPSTTAAPSRWFALTRAICDAFDCSQDFQEKANKSFKVRSPTSRKRGYRRRQMTDQHVRYFLRLPGGVPVHAGRVPTYKRKFDSIIGHGNDLCSKARFALVADCAALKPVAHLDLPLETNSGTVWKA